MFEKKKIHFVGIGGIGMSAIAEILFKKKFIVTGSDINKNLITKRLSRNGIKVFYKHSSNNIIDSDIVVYSSAIKSSNIEIKTAKKKKIPLYSRAMMLAEVMRLKPSITVSGSHGKTTTTSLIASILLNSGCDPTIINGGIINNINANAKLGDGQWIVVEADESDGSFTMLPSTVGVINNIDFEHVDFYKNIKEVKNSFIKYAERIPFYGFLAINNDDNNIRSILNKIKQTKIFTYGLSKSSNFYAENIKTIKKENDFYTCFDIVSNFRKKNSTKNFLVPLIGNHNVLNSLCAYTVAKGLKISDFQIKKALREFKGVKRRFSIIHQNNKNMIIDDYAHHPREISVTLEALKSITTGKLITIFEPHRYSRIKNLISEFVKSFQCADMIFILPVYQAGEKVNKNINSVYLSKIFRNKYKNKIIDPVINQDSFFKNLNKIISNGDNIIFLGAGKSSKVANSFKENLKKNEI